MQTFRVPSTRAFPVARPSTFLERPLVLGVLVCSLFVSIWTIDAAFATGDPTPPTAAPRIETKVAFADDGRAGDRWAADESARGTRPDFTH